MDALEVLGRLAETGTPPNEECALIMSVGLERTITRFAEETLKFAEQGGADLRFVFAPYGRGKTHLLWALKKTASDNGFVTAYIDCNTGQSPFQSYQKTYQMIANAMVPPAVNNQGEDALKMGVDAVVERSILSVDREDTERRIKRVYEEKALSPDFRNIILSYSKLVSMRTPRESPGDELKALMRADSSYRVKITDLYRFHNWLPRPIGKLVPRNAAAWIRSLGSLCTCLEFPGLVIFFDETEQVLSMQRMSKKHRQCHLANLRNLVDHVAIGSFKGCIIYYAVVEELIEIAREELDALRQRLERVKIFDGKSVRNPRAVWVDLDELTEPGPDEKRFFMKLGQELLRIGLAAGLVDSDKDEVLIKFGKMSQHYSESISVGAVREFVKEAASYIAYRIIRHE